METGSHRLVVAQRTARAGLLVLAVLSVFVLGALFFLSLGLRPDAAREDELDQTVSIYCAAGLARPVADVLEQFNDEFGTDLKIARTGGSGQLAGQIRTEALTGVQQGADLYITADEMLLEKARQEGTVAEIFDLALQRPVVAVRADGSIQENSFRKIVENKKLKIGITSSRAAVGKLTRKIAERDGFLDELNSSRVTDFENVMTLAQALVTGSIDVAVVWDTTIAQVNRNSETKDQLRILCTADPADHLRSNIAIGVIASTDNPTLCLKLARYLTAPEKSQKIFESYGFSFLSGDAWAEIPEIDLYCGSMFTPVIEKAVREFARREGINLYPKWEGCGKLVARMKSFADQNDFPDAYFACDRMFLEKVHQHFRVPTTVSRNEIVIAIRNDLADAVHGPDDLTAEGIRVGICDPEQSALGTLTRLLLENEPYSGVYEKIRAKASVTVDVGPTLVSQLQAGGLDAIIVYRSNIMADPDGLAKVKLISFDSNSPYSVATQPWAISKYTRYPNLMNRMFDWIQKDQIRRRFREYGFELVSPTVK